VEHFSGHPDSFADRGSSDGHDHEFLEIHFVIGVGSTVEDVGHRDGQDAGFIRAQIFEEGNAEEICCCAGYSHGNTKDRVGSQLGFVLGPIECDHGAVDGYLVKCIHSFKFGGDEGVDIVDGLKDAFAHETLFVPITELDCFMHACGGSRWNRGPAHGAVFEDDIDFHGRIATRVKYLSCFNKFNNTHGYTLLL
jgi:hypothetical protein